MLVLIAVAPSLWLIVSQQRNIRDAIVRDALWEADQIVKIAALNEDQSLEEARKLLVALANVGQVRRSDPVEYREFLKKILEGDDPFANFGLLDRNGDLICSAVASNEAVNLSGRPFFREEKSLEERLRQTQRIEAVGRLAGGIAHDFNNLLTAITGYSELLLARLSEEDPARHELEEIRKVSDRAAGLTRQLLAFSRKQILQPKILDLNAVVGTIDKMLQRLIGEDIDLVTNLGEGFWTVMADPGQVEQVIMNLAVNSRDAMPRGGMLIIETANVELDDAYARRHIAVIPGTT